MCPRASVRALNGWSQDRPLGAVDPRLGISGRRFGLVDCRGSSDLGTGTRGGGPRRHSTRGRPHHPPQARPTIEVPGLGRAMESDGPRGGVEFVEFSARIGGSSGGPGWSPPAPPRSTRRSPRAPGDRVERLQGQATAPGSGTGETTEGVTPAAWATE